MCTSRCVWPLFLHKPVGLSQVCNFVLHTDPVRGRKIITVGLQAEDGQHRKKPHFATSEDATSPETKRWIAGEKDSDNRQMILVDERLISHIF